MLLPPFRALGRQAEALEGVNPRSYSRHSVRLGGTQKRSKSKPTKPLPPFGVLGRQAEALEGVNSRSYSLHSVCLCAQQKRSGSVVIRTSMAPRRSAEASKWDAVRGW